MRSTTIFLLLTLPLACDPAAIKSEPANLGTCLTGCADSKASATDRATCRLTCGTTYKLPPASPPPALAPAAVQAQIDAQHHEIESQLEAKLAAALTTRTAEHAAVDKDQLCDAGYDRFRAGDYLGGLLAATDRLDSLIAGEPLPSPSASVPTGSAPDRGFDWDDLAIFLFLAVPVAASISRAALGRSLGALATGVGAGALALWVTASLLIGLAAGVIALLYAMLAGGGSSFGRRGTGWGGARHCDRGGGWRTGDEVGRGGGACGCQRWGGRHLVTEAAEQREQGGAEGIGQMAQSVEHEGSVAAPRTARRRTVDARAPIPSNARPSSRAPNP